MVFQTLGELSSHIQDNGGGVLDVVDPGTSLIEGSFDPRDVWKEQPSVRKVVDFIARGHAPIPRNLYERVSDTERNRITDHPVARVLKQPNSTPGMTAYRFWHTIIVDYLIYDRWCIFPEWKSDGELELHRIPARKVRFKTNGLDEVTKVVMFTDGQRREYDASKFILDHGYAHSGANGTSPMATLGDILREQTESVQYRRDLWARGARFPGVVTRKSEWPNPKARARFKKGFDQFARGGAQAGGWLLLEDDMDAKAIDGIKPSDAQDLDGRTLSDIQTSSAYHIAPELIGARPGTFSNIKAFLEALYGPALRPIYTSVDQALNAWLTRGTDLYIEANIDAMMRGDFEAQLQSLQSGVGAPWLTRNEGRARQNLPPIAGGDDLVVPLNVLIGGQANPRDSAPKSIDYLANLAHPDKVCAKSRQAHVKTADLAGYSTQTENVLLTFFERQGKAVLSALGAGIDNWWDQERWDGELGDDLFKLAVVTSTDVGRAAAESGSFDPDEYDVDRTLAFLRVVTASRAAMINSSTKERLDEAIADDEQEPADVFTQAKDTRAQTAAATLVTAFASFAIQEVGRQLARETATKTWVVTSSNPRPSHALMDGETVGVEDTFSNGMDWPGDSAGGADEVAGCTCELEITFQ